MITFPFNFQPVSTTVRTGSYSIPSGQYAYVTATAKNGGTFSIGGTVALDSDGNSWNVLATSPVDYTTTGTGNSLKTGGTGDSDNGDAFTSETAYDRNNVAASFWVAESTSLDSSGDARYTVTLYNNIS